MSRDSIRGQSAPLAGESDGSAEALTLHETERLYHRSRDSPGQLTIKAK